MSRAVFALGWCVFVVSFLVTTWKGRKLTRRIGFLELFRARRPSDAAEASVWWWSRVAGAAWLLMIALFLAENMLR